MIKIFGSFFHSSFDYLANDLNASVFFAHPRVVSNRLFNDMGVGCASRRMGGIQVPSSTSAGLPSLPPLQKAWVCVSFLGWRVTNADGVMTLVSIIVQSFFAWSANDWLRARNSC